MIIETLRPSTKGSGTRSTSQVTGTQLPSSFLPSLSHFLRNVTLWGHRFSSLVLLLRTLTYDSRELKITLKPVH